MPRIGQQCGSISISIISTASEIATSTRPEPRAAEQPVACSGHAAVWGHTQLVVRGQDKYLLGKSYITSACLLLIEMGRDKTPLVLPNDRNVTRTSSNES